MRRAVFGARPSSDLIAAEVCERGGRYLNLSLDLPAPLRGQELSAGQMRDYGARIEEYRVTRVRPTRDLASL